MTHLIHNTDDYCRDLVSRDDPARYLATLFAPRTIRGGVWALLAFNQEIAKTREVVTNTTIGLMRLQWWRDSIEKMLVSGVPIAGNPVAVALFGAIQAHHLHRDAFETLIYAREFDLEDVLPANIQGLEHYADYTTTPLLELIATVHGVEIDRERLRYLAIAYALVGLVRSVPYHARQGRCYLPQDGMERAGVALDQIYALRPVPDLALVVRDVLSLAAAHLDRATGLGGVRMFAAMRAQTALYLAQLNSVNGDVFNPALARSPAFMELRVAWSVYSGRGG